MSDWGRLEWMWLAAALYFWGAVSTYFAMRVAFVDAERWVGHMVPHHELDHFGFLALMLVAWWCAPIVYLYAHFSEDEAIITAVTRRAYQGWLSQRLNDEMARRRADAVEVAEPDENEPNEND